MQDAVSAFKEKYPKESETITVLHGYALAEITYQALKKA